MILCLGKYDFLRSTLPTGPRRSVMDLPTHGFTLPNDIKRAAFDLAANFHDHGKKCERWRRPLVFPKGLH